MAHMTLGGQELDATYEPRRPPSIPIELTIQVNTYRFFGDCWKLFNIAVIMFFASSITDIAWICTVNLDMTHLQ